MGFSALAAVGVGQSIWGGQKAKRQQKKAVRRQEAAQRQATAKAAGEQRRSEQERRRLNRKRPDVESLLTGARKRGRGGAAGTVMTGPGGAGALTLGGGSLLGG